MPCIQNQKEERDRERKGNKTLPTISNNIKGGERNGDLCNSIKNESKIQKSKIIIPTHCMYNISILQ